MANWREQEIHHTFDLSELEVDVEDFRLSR